MLRAVHVITNHLSELLFFLSYVTQVTAYNAAFKEISYVYFLLTLMHATCLSISSSLLTTRKILEEQY
jgi:hypothetical protein